MENLNKRITEEEIDLIKRAKNNDRLAFNKLYEAYKDFVTKVLDSYIHDIDESKDLTNVVFLKVYDKLNLFTDYSSFGGWLRILSKNTAIDYMRAMARKPAYSNNNETLLSNDNLGSDYNSEANIADRLDWEMFIRKFDKLEESHRIVCEKYYAEHYTMQEISEELNIPIGTVKSTLHRFRKHLHKLKLL